MSAGIIVLIILAALFLIGLARCIYEVHTIQTVRYSLKSSKIPRKMKLVFLSDLHGRTYGKDNEKLIALIKAERPDAVLIGGDLIVAGNPKRMMRQKNSS